MDNNTFMFHMTCPECGSPLFALADTDEALVFRCQSCGHETTPEGMSAASFHPDKNTPATEDLFIQGRVTPEQKRILEVIFRSMGIVAGPDDGNVTLCVELVRQYDGDDDAVNRLIFTVPPEKLAEFKALSGQEEVDEFAEKILKERIRSWLATKRGYAALWNDDELFNWNSVFQSGCLPDIGVNADPASVCNFGQTSFAMVVVDSEDSFVSEVTLPLTLVTNSGEKVERPSMVCFDNGHVTFISCADETVINEHVGDLSEAYVTAPNGETIPCDYNGQLGWSLKPPFEP